MNAKSRCDRGEQPEARRPAQGVRRRLRTARRCPPRACSPSSTATASTRASAPLPTTPGGTLPNTAPDPGARRSPPARSSACPSINVRVRRPTQHAGSAVPADHAATRPSSSRPPTAAPPPTRARPSSTTPPPAAVCASLPEPGFPYGSYKLCAQRTVSGDHARPRRPAHGDRQRRLRHEADHHGRRRDRGQPRRRHDRQHERPTGTPTIAANPIYPNTPCSRHQRLDHHPAQQDRAMRVTRPSPHLGRARLHAHRDARGDVGGHGRSCSPPSCCSTAPSPRPARSPTARTRSSAAGRRWS